MVSLPENHNINHRHDIEKGQKLRH